MADSQLLILGGLDHPEIQTRVIQAVREKAMDVLILEDATPASQDTEDVDFAKLVTKGSINEASVVKMVFTHPDFISDGTPFQTSDSNIRTRVDAQYPEIALGYS